MEPNETNLEENLNKEKNVTKARRPRPVVPAKGLDDKNSQMTLNDFYNSHTCPTMDFKGKLEEDAGRKFVYESKAPFNPSKSIPEAIVVTENPDSRFKCTGTAVSLESPIENQAYNDTAETTNKTVEDAYIAEKTQTPRPTRNHRMRTAAVFGVLGVLMAGGVAWMLNGETAQAAMESDTVFVGAKHRQYETELLKKVATVTESSVGTIKAKQEEKLAAQKAEEEEKAKKKAEEEKKKKEEEAKEKAAESATQQVQATESQPSAQPAQNYDYSQSYQEPAYQAPAQSYTPPQQNQSSGNSSVPSYIDPEMAAELEKAAQANPNFEYWFVELN